MRDFLFYLHLVASFLFVVFLITLLYRSAYKHIKGIAYSHFDKTHVIFTLSSLYLQSVLGVYLYFSDPENFIAGTLSPETLSHNAFLRFWNVEHFIMMFFTLVIAQLGYFSATYTQNKLKKHQKLLRYYIAVFVLVGVSLAFAHFK